MPKRGENIRKRKDGRWEGRYKTHTNGKTVYKSIYGHTYSEVKEKLKTRIQKVSTIFPSQQNSYLFKDVLYLWIHSNKIKIKGATESKYYYLIEKHIVPDLGDFKVNNVTAFVINDFLTKKLTHGRLDKRGGLSGAYVRTMAHIISSALNFAVSEQLCLPIKLIQKPAAEKKELSILSFYEQQKLENCLMCGLDKTKLGILLSLNLGLRIGEVCALTWDDIDLEIRIIRIRSTVSRVTNEVFTNADNLTTDRRKPGDKTTLIIDKPKTKSSLRDIPIPAKLLSILKRMKEQRVSKYVVSERANFVSPRTFEYRYHRVLEESNIAPINFHALRHTFATRCVEAGVDVKTLSEILGHADVSITLNTYVHSSMELKRIQIEKMCLFSPDQDLKVVKNVV